MVANITFSGLASGTDWASIVDKLVELERTRENQLKSWKTEWQNKITSIQGLNSRLLNLQSCVDAYHTSAKFQATTTTSSNTNVLTATSTSAAILGSHTVTIGSDVSHKLASQGVAAASSVVCSRNGTMTIYVGSSHIDVPVTNGMTVSDLQPAIEGADAGNILTAEIMDDGSSSNSQRLCLTANTGGSSNRITVTANPTSLTFADNAINPVVNGAIWTGTSQAASSGYYLGNANKTYTFSVPNINLNGSNAATSISWTKTGGGSGTLIIPAHYVAGTDIAVDGQVNDTAHSSGWTGTSRATSGGNYTGSTDKFYTFSVPTGTVGSGDLNVTWSESTTGRTGTITIPNSYVAGTALNVDGVNTVVEGSWTGTSHATSSGNYTAADNQQYTFTVPDVTLDGTNAEVTVNWTKVGGGAGSFTIPANYVAGTALDVENGLKISFDAGTLKNGETFTVDTEQGPQVSFSDGTLVSGDSFSVDARKGLKVSFSSGTLVNTENFSIDTFGNLDAPETATWTGTAAVSSAGHYLGSTNKTYNFTVINSGTVGTNELGLMWTDSEGNSGTVYIPSSYVAGTNIDVSQGLKINLGAGTLAAGNTFSINAYSPTTQGGQDSGLAQVEQAVHSGFADSNTTPVTNSAATFSFIYGGKRFSVAVDSHTTLSGLVAVINAAANNPGVTASILNDGMGLGTSYHLVLTGNNTGAVYTIKDIQDTFTGGTFSAENFATTQKAQNAMLKVDGYPSGTSQYMQRLSNSVSDVINGVTLSFVGPGSAAVSTSEDVAKIQTNINDFISSVNFVLDYIRQETKYDADTKQAGTMIGNYSYEIVQQRITDILTSAVPGLTPGVDAYTHLSQVGIKTNPDDDGKWEVDSDTLSNALNTNYQAVTKLFAKNEATGTNGILELLSQELDKLNDTENGPMNILIKSYDGIISNIDDQVASEDKRIALVQDRLNQQFSNLETLLATLSGQETSLQTLIQQLPNTNKSTSSSG